MLVNLLLLKTVANKVIVIGSVIMSVVNGTNANLTNANTLIFLITNRNVEWLFIKNILKLGLIKWILYEIVKHICLIVFKLRHVIN